MQPKKNHYNCKCTFLLPFFLITFFLVNFAGFSQNTHIPDANFRKILLDDYNINSKNDSILNSDAIAIDTLDVSSKNISRLSGIESFTSLTHLNCAINQLNSLNVSANTNLIRLDCYTNSLSALDVSANTNLKNLHCDNNQLTTLDISKNANLGTLNCSNNRLISLNLKNGNDITELDIDTYRFTCTIIGACVYILDARDNPDLTCIETDNSRFATYQGGRVGAYWCRYDIGTASFSVNCATAGNKDFEITGVSISPNPTRGIINITVDEKANYRFLNIRGQIIGKGVLSKGDNSVSFSSLAKGIYLLNIKTNKGSFTERIIKKN